MAQLFDSFADDVWAACLAICVISLIASYLCKTMLKISSGSIVTVGSCIWILMLPLYGNVLSVRFALPRQSTLTQEEVCRFLEHSILQYVFVDWTKCGKRSTKCCHPIKRLPSHSATYWNYRKNITCSRYWTIHLHWKWKTRCEKYNMYDFNKK